jgi:hypothetical protein
MTAGKVYQRLVMRHRITYESFTTDLARLNNAAEKGR